MDVRERSHRLDGHSILVDELKTNALADGRLEVDASVFIDGHGPEYDSGESLFGETDPGIEQLLGRLGEVLDDPEFLEFCSLGVGQVGYVGVHHV